MSVNYSRTVPIITIDLQDTLRQIAKTGNSRLAQLSPHAPVCECLRTYLDPNDIFAIHISNEGFVRHRPMGRLWPKMSPQFTSASANPALQTVQRHLFSQALTARRSDIMLAIAPAVDIQDLISVTDFDNAVKTNNQTFIDAVATIMVDHKIPMLRQSYTCWILPGHYHSAFATADITIFTPPVRQLLMRMPMSMLTGYATPIRESIVKGELTQKQLDDNHRMTLVAGILMDAAEHVITGAQFAITRIEDQQQAKLYCKEEMLSAIMDIDPAYSRFVKPQSGIEIHPLDH